VFARKTDDALASFAKHLDDFVGQNTAKKAKGTVILLADKDATAPELKKIAKDKKLSNVPLTVSIAGADGPSAYELSKKVPVTVVVYTDHVVTATFNFDTLDPKAQDSVLAAFAKVLKVDAPPKIADDKADAPKADAPKADAPKADAPKADAPKPTEGTKKEPD
jgi:hypothetical protein